MARGNGGEAVFDSDDGPKTFHYRLGQVCESCELKDAHA